MKLYLALSCLQGQNIKEAIDKLLSLNPYGLQLTSGNKFKKGFDLRKYLKENKINYQVHHNFSFDESIHYDLWSFDKDVEYNNSKILCLNNSFSANSIHPPLYKKFKKLKFKEEIDIEFMIITEIMKFKQSKIALELMYDPKEYPLSNDYQINLALERGLNVAVDISHLKILAQQKHINKKTLQRILDYDNIKEIHISDNDGKRDSHHKISKDTFLLSWVKKQYQQDPNIPIILECFMQRMNQEERLEQINIIKEALN